MRFRGPLLLMNVLIVLGLILTDVAVGFPRATVTNQARAATSRASEGMSSPALAGKRAKVKRQRQQDDRQEAKQDRKKDRKQTDRKSDRKQSDPKPDREQPVRKQDRQPQNRRLSTQQESGKPVELGGGPLPGAMAVASDKPNVEDRYIVLLADGINNAMRTTNDIAASVIGITPTHVYEHVFDGFAAVIPDEQLDDVKQDPRVLAVVPDEVGYPSAQIVTTGITRIGAHLDPTANIDGFDDRVDVDVAVLDTAGDDFHEDLNIWAWDNCTDSPVNSDVDCHGTHVGGTIGALDNDFGVVGVAPGRASEISR